MEQKDKLKLLKEILLTEDRVFAQTITKKIESLNSVIYKKKNLSEKVDPIIDDKLQDFVEEIPNTLGPTITKTLKEEIKNSQDAVVEALYPILGKMVKKYIQNEMKMLAERINSQVQSSFSAKTWKRKFKSFFTGVKEEEIILSDLAKPEIEQIFIIEKNSGILSGSYSKKETIDKDLISGMLTAIKSFVEDAFSAGNQDLESIEYELYNIHIQNFHNYYIAVVISGAYNQAYKNNMENKLLDFSEHVAKDHVKEQDLSKELETYFKNA
ncbi:MAG: cell envelope biogenesis protein OmpA [Bacteroidia bacterium]|nr:cell envelope biogenesis protein OmpA [Bacteroidia bacterium]